MVFQDPQAPLNPRRRVLDLVGEAPALHGMTQRRDGRAYVADVLREVGSDLGMALDRLQHQFSGGQRQRIGIASRSGVH